MRRSDSILERSILGVPIQTLDREDALAAIERALRGEGAPLPVAFANAHTLNLAARDPKFRSVLCHSWVLPDGIGLDLAARALHGAPFPANLNGTDFVPHLLDRCAHPLRIAMLGARPERLALAAAASRARWPRHEVVVTLDGYRPHVDEGETARLIAAARPDLLLVALGNPRQEMWLHRHFTQTGARVGMGVGALFDFLSGEIVRAPFPVRRARLEWAWRLALEPRRLAKRYVVGNAMFLARVARQRLATGAMPNGRLKPGQADHGCEGVADLHQREGAERPERHAEREALHRDDRTDDDERSPSQRRTGDEADHEGGGDHERAPLMYGDRLRSTQVRPDHDLRDHDPVRERHGAPGRAA